LLPAAVDARESGMKLQGFAALRGLVDHLLGRD
jgi:hypothetical protein